jgi:site-specific recombinase XerD
MMSDNTGKATLSIIKHIPGFLDYCEIEKGLSNNTQKNYQRYLKKFCDWLVAIKKENIMPHELTSEDVTNYRLYLSRNASPETKQLLKKSTQNYYLIALRSLLGYFSEKNITSLPSDKIKLPKDARKEKTVKFLNLEQIERLLNSPDTTNNVGIRDRAILETLFSTGLRIAELTALNKDQFENLKNKKDFELSIIGKGGYPRTVYFSEKALLWLKKYLETYNSEEKSLFRLTPRSIERIVKKYSILSGIPIFTTPHTLRHSLATDFLMQGVDIRTIQEFLGHRSITSTQIYTHVTNKHLRDIHRKFHAKKAP